MRKTFIVFFILLFIVGCKESVLIQENFQFSSQNSEDNQSQVYNIPMPSEVELNNYSTQYGVINYKYARQFSYTELISNIDIFFPAYLGEIMGSLENGEELPIPSKQEIALEKVKQNTEIVDFSKGILTYVDVDFLEYRRKVDTKTVRRNVALPSWLNYEADQAGVNVSRILQEALISTLKLERRI